jgi:CBS domain-containing protein
MERDTHPAGRGRDLTVLTLEITGATGTRTLSSVLCPREQRAKPLDDCLPCTDSLGLDRDPGARPGFVECLGEDVPRPAPRREPGDPEASLADRTPVQAVMTHAVVAFRADLPLDRARALFLDRGIGGAPVVDEGGRPMGVLSKTDLLRAGAPRAGLTVADAMSRDVLTVSEAAPVSEAAALLAGEGLHRAPVLGRDGRVVGMLTVLDLLRWLAQQDGQLMPSGHSLQAR